MYIHQGLHDKRIRTLGANHQGIAPYGSSERNRRYRCSFVLGAPASAAQYRMDQAQKITPEECVP
jgi:hypothetical protein